MKNLIIIFCLFGLSFCAKAQVEHIDGQTKLINPTGRTLLIEKNDDDSWLTFHDPGQDWYSMGIDQSNLGSFSLNSGGTLNSSHFVMKNNGYVGIGSSNPDTPLHITNSTDAIMTLQTNDNTWLYMNWKESNGTRRTWMGLDNNLSSFNIRVSNNTDKIILDGGDVGIGTTTPSAKLDVNGNIKATDHITVNKSGSYRIALNGTADGYIYGRNDNVENTFLIHSNGSSWFNGGNVGIGTTVPDSKLTVKGNIHAEEVKVDLSVPGPDYVFMEGYDLKSLEEVQSYIKKHGHLPNIPSAKEMETNGIPLGEMNMKLLEKIEELTLYVIELKKENKKQQIQINKLLNK